MSRIPQDFIDDLLNRIDIVGVVDHRVKLKKAGKNYSACCPFHDEKTPSFTVSPDKQFYYCFGCGATGNALGFLMEYERQSFVDAIEQLARSAGMEIPKERQPGDDKRHQQRKQLHRILDQASQYFQIQLKRHPAKKQAIGYLKNRGLSGQIAKNYGLGYAPPGWDNLLLNLGSNEQNHNLLIESGLVIDKKEENKRYDRFRHRIMFPIHDIRGRVIAFGGRVLGDDKPKYLNSPETPVFHKARELYGLYEANKHNKKLDHILVVEGYMDVIALAQFGITNAVATLGTACNEDHLSLAFRYTRQVVFCFDGDKAGRNAAKRALVSSLSSMDDGRQVKFLFLPDGQDPDSLIRQFGAERFQSLVSHATALEEYVFEVAAEQTSDISTMEGRAHFSKLAAPMVAKLPEGVFRELMFSELAKRTGLAPELLRELQKEAISLPPEVSREPAQAASNNNAPPTNTGNSRTEAQPSEGTIPNTSPNVAPSTENEGQIPPNTFAPDPYDQYLSAAPDDQYAPSAPADYEQDYSTRGAKQSVPQKRKTSITLPPVIKSTVLLLDHPQLIQELDIPEIQREPDNPELERLLDIIEYFKKRPNNGFNSILGFWGGAKGIEAQQQLAKLVAKPFLGEVKTLSDYNKPQELHDHLNSICQAQTKQSKMQELNTLKARASERPLNDEDKLRFRELLNVLYSIGS
ncbi:MAG: DNA primase [Alteromonadaceae bacterium]|nr:MAG: DNA primase [Alteromonadaceae bacterium]